MAAPAGTASLGRQHCTGPCPLRHMEVRQSCRIGRSLQQTTRLHASQGGSNNPKGGREWLQTLLSRFGPMTERAQNTTVLDFEKPLVELDNRIREVSRSDHQPVHAQSPTPQQG